MPIARTPWSLPGDPVSALQAVTKQYVDRLSGRYSVMNYGAVGDGTTDDTAAINAAIAACPAGGIVFFPPGHYAISSPIIVPPQITLEGSHRDVIWYTGAAAIPVSITALATFAGNGMIKLMGKADQSPPGSVDHVGAAIRFLVIDGTGLPGGSATRGIRVEGVVRDFLFEHVTVRHVNDTGFWFGAGATSGLMPSSFRLLHCLADTCANNGYTFTNTPDSTVFDCNALGNTNVGFYIAGFMNGQIANCRAEWSGLQGFYFTSGYWGTGQGSGGCNVIACSTDRSNQDGIRIDATGGAVLQFTNCFNRRDGRNGGTGGNGYAAFNVMAAATMPVIVDNHQAYPGVDDNGTGTNSPQIGFLTANTAPVTLNSGYIWAATTALSVAATTVIDSNVGTATGLTTAPTRVAPVGDVPLTRQVIAGTGLTGGGSLAADRTLAVAPRSIVTALTTPGANTYTIPTGAVTLHIFGVAGGGGGASGQFTASGTAGQGGGGGAGGGIGDIEIPAAAWQVATADTSLTINVGAGGAGGVSNTVASVPKAGTAGGNFSVVGAQSGRTYFTVLGGPGAGTGTASAGGAVGTSQSGGGGGIPGSGAIGGGGANPSYGPGGGGAGGGAATTQATVFAGGAGSINIFVNPAATVPAGGTSGSKPGGVGTSGPANMASGGNGAGGGAGGGTAAGGIGGAGGTYGAGGGGGGAGTGFASGAGGAGAQGIVIVVAYL